MIDKIGKITVYVEVQEQEWEFLLNKLGFVLKFGQLMGPDAWIEVGRNDDDLPLSFFIRSLQWKSFA
ncbi:hypothetical protein D8M04_13050 [Oceanobacillus piezotolerans]|uniref:Uncharacterized protein n=1 Tax=Oceanobacillus piezotolerans TaxID=2448030 RepID=A0A498DCG4_9BACI|nr:hypothetical protein D8M04_13050 [Oceanobacillus piezotolerans]